MSLDHPEMATKLRDVPAIAAEEANARLRRDDWIALAGDGLDERGFSAAVGPQDSNMLAVGDAQIDVVKHNGVATGDIHVLHIEKARIANIDAGFRVFSSAGD